MSGYEIGQKVIHPLHGIGTVKKIEEKEILGKIGRFSEIYFNNDRLKIMVNLELNKSLIRGLVSQDEIPKVFKYMKKCNNKLPLRSSERYNFNMKRIKSSDIYNLAAVIKDLSELKKSKKLSAKEESMLKQTRKILSSEVSFVKEISEEEAEKLIDQVVKED
ncbi:MAG: hypothetical protein K8T10_08590 [Candidatus Eremiobacteraeota bacterium]|nr:hypothetical protein [Candidatus Eremiobacteraeota bacterium]